MQETEKCTVQSLNLLLAFQSKTLNTVTSSSFYLNSSEQKTVHYLICNEFPLHHPPEIGQLHHYCSTLKYN